MMATAIRRFMSVLHNSWVSGKRFGPLAAQRRRSYGPDVLSADVLVSYRD